MTTPRFSFCYAQGEHRRGRIVSGTMDGVPLTGMTRVEIEDEVSAGHQRVTITFLANSVTIAPADPVDE